MPRIQRMFVPAGDYKKVKNTSDKGKLLDTAICSFKKLDDVVAYIMDPKQRESVFPLFLSKNSWRGPDIPKGAQKLLAAVYIKEVGGQAFNAGKFKFDDFQDYLMRNKHEAITYALKRSYFDNISMTPLHASGKLQISMAANSSEYFATFDCEPGGKLSIDKIAGDAVGVGVVPDYGKLYIDLLTFYTNEFKDYFGEHAKALLLNKRCRDWVESSLKSITLYTSLAVDAAKKWFTQRDIVNIGTERPFEHLNDFILGCKTSYPQLDSTVLESGNQLSAEMIVPFRTENGDIKFPTILSVAAPALDSDKQLDWPNYCDAQGNLKPELFRKALETINSHIVACSDRSPTKKVVLSAFGMEAFLNGLSRTESAQAKKIGAECQAKLIKELLEKNRSVFFTALNENDSFWKNVNIELQPDKTNMKIQAVDRTMPSIPGNWIADDVIIVNAWDPHSLLGNGCFLDRSLDGYIGRNSIIHFVHALACVISRISTNTHVPVTFKVVDPAKNDVS